MQYYEVVGELVHKWAGVFSLVICILAALGSCIPQIVASSANVYRINDTLNKRDWAIIFGAHPPSPSLPCWSLCVCAGVCPYVRLGSED